MTVAVAAVALAAVVVTSAVYMTVLLAWTTLAGHWCYRKGNFSRRVSWVGGRGTEEKEEEQEKEEKEGGEREGGFMGGRNRCWSYSHACC